MIVLTRTRFNADYTRARTLLSFFAGFSPGFPLGGALRVVE
jgi:hypothetical protein